MSVAGDRMSSRATPGTVAPRAVRWIRSLVLLVAGLVIAFTATLHHELAFTRWALALSLAAIGVSLLAEFTVTRRQAGSGLALLRAILALVAAAVAALVPTIVALSVVTALWAVAEAAVAVLRAVTGRSAPSAALPTAFLGVGLALALVLVRDDAVAVIGFFGAYAMIRGVFLGISAVDGRDPAVARPDPGAALRDPSAAL